MSYKIGVMGLILGLAACSGGDETTTPPGVVPVPPSATESNSAPVIETSTISGLENVALSVTISASDADGDAISFTLIESPDWLTVNASGAASGTPGSADIGSSTIIVEASDGTDASRAEITLDIASDPIDQALRTGDFSIIAAETDLTPAGAFLQEVQRIRDQNNADIATLYQLNANGSAAADSLTNVTWQVDDQAALLHAQFGSNAPLLISNVSGASQSTLNQAIGVFGRTENSRFVLLGDNPMRAAEHDPSALNEDMQQLMQNTIAWLLDNDPDSGFQVVIANLPDSARFPDDSSTRSWLKTTYGDAISVNAAGDCDGLDLDSCVTDETDLIVISQNVSDTATASTIRARIERAVADGVAVLYLQSSERRQPLGTELFDVFNVTYYSYNTRYPVSISGASPIGTLRDWQPAEVHLIENLIDGIEHEPLDYDLSDCRQYWDCTENGAFWDEVVLPLSLTRTLVSRFDFEKTRPFPASKADRLWALMVLVGDDYRSQTEFPMDKNKTSSADIVRAMFGDLTAIIYRKTNAVGNLGTYSRNQFRSDLLEDETVRLVSRRPFRTTGVYALPGETVTVTRTDSSDVQVKLRVQSIRDSANAPFRSQYDRPLVLASYLLTIEAGETLEITSATGGPIHAHFAADDFDVELDFQNIGKHPVWRGPEDTQTFRNALIRDQFDWAKFVTPYFEVHSTAEKMRETIAKPHISTPGRLGELTETYVRDWPHWLAGWEGPGIRANPDLRIFADSNGLTIPTLQLVKHMNADRPACTFSAPNCAGTSGNPYDALWNFDPIYLGDLHELGHGLEFRNMHHFEGGDPVHSTTNLYAFHTQYRHYSDTGAIAFRCAGLHHRNLFEIIQDSRSRSDPAQYMRAQDLSRQTDQTTMFVQLLAALENQGVFDDGWKLIPRLNLVTREFLDNDYDPSRWNAKAAGLGFGGIDLDTANSLSQNDWLLIALSWSAQRDLRAYLEMWGYSYSDMALDHVASLGLPSLSPAYYAIGNHQHCFGLDHPEIPIDGVTEWSVESAASEAIASKSFAFTPDYLRFDHDDVCTLGSHDDATPLMLSSSPSDTLQSQLERFREDTR